MIKYPSSTSEQKNKTYQLPEANFPPLVSCGHQQAAAAGVERSREDSIPHHFGHSLLSYLHFLQSRVVTISTHQDRVMTVSKKKTYLSIYNSKRYGARSGAVISLTNEGLAETENQNSITYFFRSSSTFLSFIEFCEKKSNVNI